MASISLSDLRVGARMAYDLRDSEGRLLLAARRPVTEAVMSSLAKRRVGELEIRDVGELPEEFRSRAPQRPWLMAAGVNVNPAGAIDAPAAESVDAPEAAAEQPDVQVRAKIRRIEHRRTVAKVRAILRGAADEIVATRWPRWRRLPVTVHAERDGFVARRAVGFTGHSPTAPTADDLRERVAIVRRMFARLASGEAVGAGTPIALVDEMIEETSREPLGAMARVVLCAREGADDLSLHAYCVSCVSVGIAMQLGWSEADARSAGLTGLLADCGLTLMPWDVRSMPRALTDVETNALHRHAAWSAGMIELIHEDGPYAMDEAVQLAVYQHHEREDATGYPTRARCETIHDFARVCAVADTFVGLISARAHRPGLTPEGALAEVVRLSNAGTLARAMVRGLALALGLRASSEVVVPGRGARVAA